ARTEIMRAWLVPQLGGSATSDRWRAHAIDLLHSWLEFVHAQHRRTGRERFGLSFEIALAQGFKHAANRRREHPHAPDKARTHLAECDHLNWPRSGLVPPRILAPPGW